MQVVYNGRQSRRVNPSPHGDGDVLEILSNNWNDYGYETSFQVVCRIKGEAFELPGIRLLFEGEYNSRDFLRKILNEGWDGVFPVPNASYISVATDITFYEQIEGAAGTETAVKVARFLNDASYLIHIAEDKTAQELVKSEGFKKSLQRERASAQAFIDGWRVFERRAIAVLDLGFSFRNVTGELSKLNLHFQPSSLLPHDVNVLIGPNGYGKSQLLHQIVRDWISPSAQSDIGFSEKPNLSQLVVVSYSPFERFPVDLLGQNLRDKDVYRYFGLRGRAARAEGQKRGEIKIDHVYPKRNAVHSLIQCLADDKRLRDVRDWSRKVETMERVLRAAIDFDFAAVAVSWNRKPESFYLDTTLQGELWFDVSVGSKDRRYIPIRSDRIDELNDEELIGAFDHVPGVVFFRDRKPIELSSGQRLFAYIVINILGAIRRNSLILVDEPELFLHPSLEVQFIDMLKTILSRFNSKALLATHSVVTVREVPSNCVHVFEKTDDGIVLKHPPFQTFGGDFQRISSYVFGDRAVSKPFESWIKELLSQFPSADALIEEMGEDLNEELIIQIKAMERNQW